MLMVQAGTRVVVYWNAGLLALHHVFCRYNTLSNINVFEFTRRIVLGKLRMGSKSSKSVKHPASTGYFKDPTRLTFVTWNIDGLHRDDREDRTIAVVEELERVEADIVFLQEVVWEMFVLIRTRLAHIYECIAAKREFYFVATLLKKSCVRVEKHQVIDFETSLMERHLLSARVHCGKEVLELLNTHLESLAEHGEERRRQLSRCYEIINKYPATRTVILAGDMNMENSWLHGSDIEFIPAGIQVKMSSILESLLTVNQ